MDYGKWIERYSADCRLKYPSEATRKNYISQIISFCNRFKNYEQPKSIPTEDIKNWLLESKTPNTRNHKLCAIKSFYELTVGMPLKLDRIPFSKKEQKLPMPLSKEEVELLFKNCDNLKHKAIMSLLFGCGMRVGEVLNLKPGNIDRSNGVIHIVNGKGNKDRMVPLHASVLSILENYYRAYKPKIYMFNGQFPEKDLKYSERSINAFFKQIAVKAKIKKNVHSHLGRHSYASNLLIKGTDLGLIQKILGHKKLETTMIYTKVTSQVINKIDNPFVI